MLFGTISALSFGQNVLTYGGDILTYSGKVLYDWDSYWANHIRGNTVGVIAVTPESYDTNADATTVTVGASGATYTNLITAYNAASAGDVIELIDDTHTLTAALFPNKSADGTGKAIKIKGKATLTTLNLADVADPIYATWANAAIEFENIAFVDPFDDTNPLYILSTVTDGLLHCINCTFDFAGNMTIQNSKDLVFDGCTFTGTTAAQVMVLTITATINAAAKWIFNDCTSINTTPNYFFRVIESGDVRINELFITNSNFYAGVRALRGTTYANNFSIKGNTIRCIGASAGVVFGAEATGLTIPGFSAYNAGTSYVTGDVCYNVGVLWESVNNSLNSEPLKANVNWKPAELYTGEIENNLIYRDTYAAAQHGIFVGYGCYDVSVTNNIVSNFWYNAVFKGFNNTIQYNCIGSGSIGMAFFANDQAIVSNNTIRVGDNQGILYGPQATAGIGPMVTTFRDNIVYTPDATDVILQDFSDRWTAYPGDSNTFNQNIWFGNTPKALYNESEYTFPTSFAAFKVDCGDTKAQFIDPEWVDDVDATIANYYTPDNISFAKLKDSNSQSIGAVDLYELQ